MRHQSLIDPQSIAIIGASNRASTYPAMILHYLLKHDYPGRVYPINPQHDEVRGVKCYARLEDLPEAPDVVVITTPIKTVPDVLRSCLALDIGYVVVISSGVDAAVTGEIRDLIAGTSLRLIGPNSPGLFNVRSKAHCSISSMQAYPGLKLGPLALIGQSGGVLAAIARRCLDLGTGLKYFVGTGNAIDMDIVELAEVIIEDDDVQAVGIYTESFREGRNLRALGEKAFSLGKQVIFLKGGRTQSGSASALSHTGRIASSSDIYNDIVLQSGLRPARTVEGMAVGLCLAARLSASKGSGGVGLFANSGGTVVLASDLLEDNNVPLAEFSESTRKAIADILPNYTGGSQVDIGSSTASQVYHPENPARVLDVMLGDPGVGCCLLSNMSRYLNANWEGLAQVIARHRTPLVLVPQDEARTLAPEVAAGLSAAGAIVIRSGSVSEAAEGIALALLRPPMSGAVSEDIGLPAGPITQVAPNAMTEGGLKGLLAREAGLNVPRGVELDPTELRDRLPSLPVCFPVVIKALGRGAEHKRAMGRMWLGVRDLDAANALLPSIKASLVSGDRLLIEELLFGERELLVSFSRTPEFGTVMSCGLGGSAAELARRISHGIFDRSTQAVRSLLDRYLFDVRVTPANMAALTAHLTRAGTWFAGQKALNSLEMNPVLVGRDTYAVVDCKAW